MLLLVGTWAEVHSSAEGDTAVVHILAVDNPAAGPLVQGTAAEGTLHLQVAVSGNQSSDRCRTTDRSKTQRTLRRITRHVVLDMFFPCRMSQICYRSSF